MAKKSATDYDPIKMGMVLMELLRGGFKKSISEFKSKKSLQDFVKEKQQKFQTSLDQFSNKNAMTKTQGLMAKLNNITNLMKHKETWEYVKGLKTREVTRQGKKYEMFVRDRVQGQTGTWQPEWKEFLRQNIDMKPKDLQMSMADKFNLTFTYRSVQNMRYRESKKMGGQK